MCLGCLPYLRHAIMCLTARIPMCAFSFDLPAEALLHVSQRIIISVQYLNRCYYIRSEQVLHITTTELTSSTYLYFRKVVTEIMSSLVLVMSYLNFDIKFGLRCEKTRQSVIRQQECCQINFDFNKYLQIRLVSHLSQQRDVGDSEPQSVDLAESLLVRERRHVHAQFVERRVYTAKVTTQCPHFSFIALNSIPTKDFGSKMATVI